MSDFEQNKDYQELHKRYQSEANEMPPEQLDLKILEAAHQSVERMDRPGVDTVSVKRSWYVPVSYVAILMISLSVVMKLAFESEFMKPELIEIEMLESETSNLSVDPTEESMQIEVARSVERKVSQHAVETETPRVAKALNQSLKKEKSRVSPQMASPAATRVDESAVSGMSVMSDNNSAVADEEVSRTGVQEPSKKLVDSQRVHIERMLELLENKQFDQLGIVLRDYRKRYPDSDVRLPTVLLDWEAKNTAQPLQND